MPGRGRCSNSQGTCFRALQGNLLVPVPEYTLMDDGWMMDDIRAVNNDEISSDHHNMESTRSPPPRSVPR